MSQVDSQYVKRGIWTNLDEGPIMGRTITTDSSTGFLLVALLAVLSTLGTGHLWNLVTFLIHQLRADGRPSDAMFRQQQALLRISPPPSTVMTDVLKLWWTWKGKAKRVFWRSLILVVIAVLFTTGTLAASIFSSLVVTSGDLVVLVDSHYCGHDPNSEAYVEEVRQFADSYARQCSHNGSLPNSCDVFAAPSVNLTTERTTCSFNDTSMCTDTEALSFDSGLQDVAKAFGMNIPASDRVQFRKKTTCQILSLKGHTEVINSPDLTAYNNIGVTGLFSGEQVLVVKYGNSNYGTDQGADSNWTFDHSLVASNVTLEFEMATFGYYANTPFDNDNNARSMNPVPQLKRDDGDTVVMIVMFNYQNYPQIIKDPFFTAKKPRPQRAQYLNGTFTQDITYSNDYPVRAFGCLQQYQFCHARSSKEDFCTDLQRLPAKNLSSMPFDFPEANDLQMVILNLLASSSHLFDMTNARALLATEAKLPDSTRTIPSLPDNQWILELQAWEAANWVALQKSVTDYAGGSGETGSVPPDDDAKRRLCQMQKMRKTGDLVNINVFGLAFMIGVSCLVAILDLVLLKFLIFLSSFRRALSPRIERWIQDGVWQLQRRAYEAEGHRTWTQLENEIPLIGGDEAFKDLPITWVPDKMRDYDEESMVAMSMSNQSIVADERQLTMTALTAGPDAQRNRPSRFRKFFVDLSHVF